MTATALLTVGSPPAIKTPMLAFLQGTHEQWIREVRRVLDPARGEDAGIWLRWHAIDYLETGFKRRFERERVAVYSMHGRLTGPQAGQLWVSGELVAQVLENVRHQVGLCHRAEQFSSLALTLLAALEHWCREVEASLGPARWGEVEADSRALFETISCDDTLLGI
jgi:hypothetical protein